MSNRWHSLEDPLLQLLWQNHRERFGSDDFEVIVMIAAALTPTSACYDGEGFYCGVDPVPVVAWRPFPPTPIEGEPRLVDVDLLIEKAKDFFKDLITAGEENVEVTEFNVRFQEMIEMVIAQGMTGL